MLEEEGKGGLEDLGLGENAGEGETPTPPGNEDVTPEDLEVKKRGAKNVLEENRRKAEEIQYLKDEIASIKTQRTPPEGSDNSDNSGKSVFDKAPAKVKAIAKKLKDLGYEDEVIEAQIQLIGYMADDITATRLKPHEKQLYRDDIDKSFNVLSADPHYKFAAEKLHKEFKDEMEKYPPHLWSDVPLAKSVLGQLVIEKGSELYEPTQRRIVPGSPTETNRGSGSGSTAEVVSDSELETFSNQFNLDISTPEAIKEVKELISKRKQVEKSYKKAIEQ